MGRKRYQKQRAKELAAKKKSVPPDDYFSNGSIEMARFGTINVLRSSMSGEQFEEMQDRLVERFPQVCREIDDKISRIVNIVRVLPPDKLLQRAYWEMALRFSKIASESDAAQDDTVATRMIDYVQSIIVSTQPAGRIQHDIAEDAWQELRALIGDIFNQLNIEYQICRTAIDRKTKPDFDLALEEYYYRAQLMWCNVRGDRYLIHDIPFLRDVLTPHNDILVDLFDISANELIDSLQSIQDSLTFGISKAREDFSRFRIDTNAKLDERLKSAKPIREEDPRKVMEEIVRENGWEGRRDSILGRLVGYDLFDLEINTRLPRMLLDELSWQPGQDTDFFGDGEYKGWPLRIWPVFKRPFIKIDEHYYCFDLYSLFDHFYRTMQHIIVRIRPGYTNTWNEVQKKTSETLPIQLLKKLMPEADVYHPVYYRWSTEPGGRTEWCETDAILIYEDFLFIIEVKAGAFTYTSPATDFPSYINSIRDLVLGPAVQGKRFLDYLNSNSSVKIYNEEHEEVGTISRNDFSRAIVCAITLDSFTELAAQIGHLKKIGIDVGEHPTWSLSIDNLREYADVFDNPLMFLHFVEHRMRAFRSIKVKADDELDHLGLYLKHNAYAQYADEVGQGASEITWSGYRSRIDRYFSQKLQDSSTMCPLRQNVPPRLRQIIELLAAGKKPGRRGLSSVILDYSGESRDVISSGIDKVLLEQSRFGRLKPLSAYGEVKCTIFCWQSHRFKRDKDRALEFTREAMLIADDKERLLLELFYDELGQLVDAEYDMINLDNIPEEELEQLKIKARELRKKRVDKAKEGDGQIGRNQDCPCGSGKKYKKCCLPRFH